MKPEILLSIAAIFGGVVLGILAMHICLDVELVKLKQWNKEYTICMKNASEENVEERDASCVEFVNEKLNTKK